MSKLPLENIFIALTNQIDTFVKVVNTKGIIITKININCVHDMDNQKQEIVLNDNAKIIKANNLISLQILTKN